MWLCGSGMYAVTSMYALADLDWTLQACHLVKFLQKRKHESEDAALLAAIDW